jgi:hypothetical protein
MSPTHRRSEVFFGNGQLRPAANLAKYLLHAADVLMQPIKGLRRDMSRARGEVAPLLSCRSSHDKKNYG